MVESSFRELNKQIVKLLSPKKTSNQRRLAHELLKVKSKHLLSSHINRSISNPSEQTPAINEDDKRFEALEKKASVVFVLPSERKSLFF